MTSEVKTMAVPTAEMLQRLDWTAAEVSAMREVLTRPPSAQVIEWVQKINEAINDPTLSQEERTNVVQSVPAPLRHAVAAECYRTNENVTFGWVAAIAGVLTFEAPDLLRAYGVEPEFTSMTAEEMEEEIAVLEARGMLRP